MNQDDIRVAPDIDAVPGQYFLCIPHGAFLIALPADTIHAGVFLLVKNSSALPSIIRRRKKRFGYTIRGFILLFVALHWLLKKFQVKLL